MALIHFNFMSKYLWGETDVNIILPDKPSDAEPEPYYSSGKKYKVLWLLHGAFGNYNDWIRRTNIENYAHERDLIVVMPNGLNSGYSNMDLGISKYAMYDFLIHELMPLIYGWFPAFRAREDNFMCGLSMGGDGSLKYAVNNPELFAGCAVLSMAPLPLTGEDGQLTERAKVKIERLGGMENYLASYENVWDRLAEVPVGSLPKLYVACGKDDSLYGRYLMFKQYIEELGHEALFEEFEGYGHVWPLWDLTVQRAMDYFGL